MRLIASLALIALPLSACASDDTPPATHVGPYCPAGTHPTKPRDRPYPSAAVCQPDEPVE